LAGAVAEVAFGECLQAPGDAAHEPGPVADPRGFVKELGVAGTQVGAAQPWQLSYFFGNVSVHKVLLSLDLGNGSP
jgi:hypothetical protein